MFLLGTKRLTDLKGLNVETFNVLGIQVLQA